MSVRWRPKGHDCRPGSRVTYWFANDVTRRKRIAPKSTDGTVLGAHNRSIRVRFDNGTVGAVPGSCLGPEGETYRQASARQRAIGDAWYVEWLRSGHRTDPMASAIRRARTWPLDPDLVDRAVKRYGPRSTWTRAWKRWIYS